jgi:hypothetical protein
MRVFRLITAAPGFFLSSWFLMLFAGVVHTDVGIRAFGYVTSMIVTIALWIVMAPAIGALSKRTRRDKKSSKS